MVLRNVTAVSFIWNGMCKLCLWGMCWRAGGQVGVCNQTMGWSWSPGGETHHKTGNGARASHTFLKRQTHNPSWFLSPSLTYFFYKSINNSLLGISQLCLNLRMMKMCCNEPLVSLNVFQDKPIQFTNQVIFFLPFKLFPMLPVLQMQPGISSLILRAQVSSPIIKVRYLKFNEEWCC